MGCSGIIVPMVNTVAYAQRIAALSKYPPVGERSVGIGRAQGYGLRFTEYLEVANEQTTVVVQIEHRDAVANVDQIVAVPGIDAVFVGPYDLSNSMGLVGQVNHPDVRAAIDKVRAACARTNSPMGIFCSYRRAGSQGDQGRREAGGSRRGHFAHDEFGQIATGGRASELMASPAVTQRLGSRRPGAQRPREASLPARESSAGLRAGTCRDTPSRAAASPRQGSHANGSSAMASLLQPKVWHGCPS